ncbi:MAG: hypothetical protein RIQ72_613, partial [Candidatus Parcubacteria bacterium]
MEHVKQFRNPEEELAYLRDAITKKEAEALAYKKALAEQALSSHASEEAVISPEQFAQSHEREHIISETIHHYSKQEPEKVLHEHFRAVPPQKEQMQESGEIVLSLSPEQHDRKMEEFVSQMYQEGIMNTIQTIRHLRNPHLEDDFHRFLVQYIKKGLPTPGLHESAPETKALRKTLYEVILPEKSSEGTSRPLKEIISSMEQFYAGMLSVSSSHGEHDSEDQFAVELAVSESSNEFVFYVSVPSVNTHLFEKQFLGVFPDAKIVEKTDDYNIFNSEGFSVASYATLNKNEVYPIKTYEQFDFDPLNVILNTLTQMQKDGEGAAIQFIFNPVGDYYTKQYKTALDSIRKGDNVKDAIDIRHTFFGRFTKAAGEVGKGFVDEFQKKKPEEKKHDKQDTVDQIALDQITQKISSPIIELNIRIVASASNRERAERIVGDIEAAFNQFENPLGNSIVCKRVKDGADTAAILHKFAYRLFDSESALPLSIREINTLLHFPGESISAQPQLKQSHAKTAPAPMDLGKE